MRKRGPPKSAPPPLVVSSLSPDEELELDFYVCCCIEEIENILLKNPSEKQKKLAEVSLKILSNPAENFIKKKQVMRQWFDDYKEKFENKKVQTMLNLNENKCMIKKADIPSKSVFYRKHEVKNISVVSKCDDYKSVSAENEDISSIKVSDNSFKFAF